MENNNMDFLQSEEWRKFQENVGRKTFHVSYPHPSPLPEGEGDFSFWANVIEHKLPIVGKYFYIPRGPVLSADAEKFLIFNFQFSKIIELAKKENAGWIRFDANNKEFLKFATELITEQKIVKAPHDMQPREVFVIDIAKSEKELLAGMKEKTRYNIKLSQKKGVQIRIMNYELGIKNNYLDKFINLVKITAERNKITAHPESYYREMFEVIPKENLKLYVAEYEGKVIAANIMAFYGDTATYLHGASDNEYRNVMAPYLLQWRAIQDAKKVGYHFYDLGGVKTENHKSQITNHKQIQSASWRTKFKIQNSSDSWYGITKFKTGFSPNTQAVEFAGSYDIIINPIKYCLYRTLQFIKSIK